MRISTTKLLAGLILVLVSMCAYLSYQLRIEREQARTQLALSNGHETAIARSAHRPPQGNDASAFRGSASAPSRAANAAFASIGEEASRFRAPDQEARQQYKQHMSSDVAARLLLARWKGALEDVYGDFIKESQLKPEQANQFYRVFLPRHDSDPPANPAAMRQYESDRRHERNAELARVLGPEHFRKYEKYETSLYARTEVRRLSDELDAANTPLQATQKARIMEIMLEESERLPQPTLVPGEDPELDRARVFKWREDYERRAGERLEKLLTPSQYERYREHQEWQREYRDLQSTMRERLQARQQ